MNEFFAGVGILTIIILSALLVVGLVLFLFDYFCFKGGVQDKLACINKEIRSLDGRIWDLKRKIDGEPTK